MRLLGDRTTIADSAASLVDGVIEVMREAPRDIPFGFIYRLQSDGAIERAREFGLEDHARADLALRTWLSALHPRALAGGAVIEAKDLAPGALPEGCPGLFAVPFRMSPVVGPIGPVRLQPERAAAVR